MPIKQLSSVTSSNASPEPSDSEDLVFAFFEMYQRLMPQPSAEQVRSLAFSIGADDEHAQMLADALIGETSQAFVTATGLDRETFEPEITGGDPEEPTDELESLLAEFSEEEDADEDEDFLNEDDDSSDDTSEDDNVEVLDDEDSLYDSYDSKDGEVFEDDTPGPAAADISDDSETPIDTDIVLTSDDLADLQSLEETADAASDIGMDADFATDGEIGDKPGPDDQAFAFDGEPEVLSDDSAFAEYDGEPEVPKD